MLYVALGVLGLIGAGFVGVFVTRGGGGGGGSSAPAPAPAPAATVTRLSEDLRLGDWATGEGAEDDAVARALAGYQSLGLTAPKDAASPAVRDNLGKVADALQAECRGGQRFDACLGWARVTHAAFAGCQAASCDGKTSGDLFVASIEATDLALDRAVGLSGEAPRAKATVQLAAQAIRLGAANHKTVAARAPRIAALGVKSCAGAAASTEDCKALTRSR